MKKLFLALLAGLMALGALAQSGTFTVKGTFEDVGDTVFFFFPKLLTGEFLPVTGQMLEMTFDLEDAQMLKVCKYRTGMYPHDIKDSFDVPAIPGETLIITKNAEGKNQVGGSQFYVDYQEALNSIEPANRAGEEFIEKIKNDFNAGVPREQLMEEYQATVPVLLQGFFDAVTGYVKAHPDQDAAAALIAELPNDIEKIEAAAALLTERARGSQAANLYKEILEEAKREAEEEAQQYALEGCPAPDFTLMDINGKPLALSSLRGKWVIIDFWGSWCGWCIKGMPKMKEYYAKYDGKLEILGVDCNDTVEKWKAAVAKHEIPWLHVYWDKEKGDNPVALYGVQGFPTKVIVDPQGKIAKIIVGEDPSFYDYLDEVLK
jgi:thiol-disulfide isomerase/thioredoxin